MTKDCRTTPVNRRTLLLGAAGALPLIALGATGAKAGKLTKDSVQYQMEPKDGKHCALCSFFVAPNSCKQVDGQIFPNGYCKLFVAKA